MKTLLLVAMVGILGVAAIAQTPPVEVVPAVPASAPTSNAVQTIDAAASFVSWVQTQQANIGLGYNWDKVKYVTTSWDLLSIGSSGLNVAKASSLDYFDFGPVTSAANAERTRYGALPLFHLGNVWNAASSHLPAVVSSHVNTTKLPDVSAGLAFFEPADGVITHWKWLNDTQFVLVMRVGGN